MPALPIFDVNRSRNILLEPTGRISAIPRDARFNNHWNNYEKQLGSFWTHNKPKYKKDAIHFPLMPPPIRESTKSVAGFFAGSDEIVEEIILESPLSLITVPEVRYTLGFEAMMENVHSTVYNDWIRAVITDEKEREHLFRAVETMPSVTKKAEWARQWISKSKPLDYTIIGKACVEGINFSSSFAWIDWLRAEKYQLDGLFLLNDEISRDENRHVETGVHSHDIIRTYNVEDLCTPDIAKEIIDGSIEVEIQFVRDVIPNTGYTGMNQNLMIDHVRHCAAGLAADLGYEGMYKGTYCPFPFMKMRSLNSKTNFFEKNSGEYSRADAKKDEDENIEEAFDENYSWTV